MNFFIPVLADVDSPEIYGEVSLAEPSIWASPWVKVAAAAAIAIVVLLIWLVVRHVRNKRLEKLRRDPLYILRTKFQSLRSARETKGKEFYGALATIMREAIGLRFKIGATQKTAKELSQALGGMENSNLADGALNVIRSCEAAQFSGDDGLDATKLMADADLAFEILSPRENGESSAGGVTR